MGLLGISLFTMAKLGRLFSVGESKNFLGRVPWRRKLMDKIIYLETYFHDETFQL